MIASIYYYVSISQKKKLHQPSICVFLPLQASSGDADSVESETNHEQSDSESETLQAQILQ